MTALELGKRIQSGDITATQAAEASLARIKAVEPPIHARMTVNEEKTMEQAGKVQAEIEAGGLSGSLVGVPVAIKDNMCTEGMRTTCNSRMPENFTSAYTAQAAANLEQAGTAILGRANMDEFVMGSTTETSILGVTRSPWSPEHAPGGPSGGPYAAVTAGEYFYALGSDTSGSIYQPSLFCGVTGVKLTYGTMSRYGLTAYGSSLDQVGPMIKGVSGCAAVLEVLVSHDLEDSTFMERNDCGFIAALSEDVRGMRIGIPESYFGQGLDQEVKDAMLEAARVLKEKGAIVETFDLKLVEYATPAYHVVAPAEASSDLLRLDGAKYDYRAPEYEGLRSMHEKNRPQGFGPEVERRTMLGSFVLSFGYYDVYYLKALYTKALIKKEFDCTFVPYDVILTPAALTTAPRLGQSLGDPLKMYLGDVHTISVNLAGLPEIGLPCDLDSEGFPTGLQLIRDCLKEKSIMRAAYAHRKAREWELLPVAAGTPEEPSGVTVGEAKGRVSHE